jgi:hypothetical protein
MPDKRFAFSNTGIFVNKAHDAILQVLERAIVLEKGQRIFLAQDAFDPKVWPGTKLVFAKDHPDAEAFEKDPVAELKRIGGMEVGTLSDAWIERTGHPKLMGKLEVTSKEVEQGIVDGKVSLSVAYWHRRIADAKYGIRTAGPVQPNHILLFYEDESNLPRDLGSMILNKDEPATTGPEQATLQLGELSVIHPKGLSAEEVEDQLYAVLRERKEVKEMADEKGDERIAELSKAVVEQKQLIANKDSEIGALRGKLADYEARERETKWTAIMNKLPEGMVHSDADKKSMRELFEKDPGSFAMKVLEFKPAAPTAPTGTEHLAKNKQERSVEDRLAALGYPSIEIDGGN